MCPWGPLRRLGREAALHLQRPTFPPSSAEAHLLKWIGGGEGVYEKYKAFYFDLFALKKGFSFSAMKSFKNLPHRPCELISGFDHLC